MFSSRIVMAPAFRDFEFILDGMLPCKLGAREKFLRDSIVSLVRSTDEFTGTDRGRHPAK